MLVLVVAGFTSGLELSSLISIGDGDDSLLVGACNVDWNWNCLLVVGFRTVNALEGVFALSKRLMPNRAATDELLNRTMVGINNPTRYP